MSSVVISGDTSGSVTLQAPAVAGTTVLSLPNASGTVVTSTNISNYTTPARGGSTYATLSTGTPNITLTSSSNQVQVVTSDAEGQSITLPDATTMTKGAGFFVFYNTSSFFVAIKDAGGTIREFLYPSTTGSPIQSTTLVLQENDTANGVWHIHNPISAGGSSAALYQTTTFNPGGTPNALAVIQVTTTQYVFLSWLTGANNSATLRATLGTINLSTKAWTFGSTTTLATNGGVQSFSNVGGDSNGVDRGLIGAWISVSNAAATASWQAWGFAIVAGTLYFSGSTTVFSLGGNPNVLVAGFTYYAGSNDNFIYWGYNYNLVFGALLTAYKVNLAGTTVSLTQCTGSLSLADSGPAFWKIAPTTRTTFVIDKSNATSPQFASYNSTTNTLSSGARTAQTSQIVDVLITNWATSGFGQNIILNNSANTKLLLSGYSTCWAITNPGAATVTVATGGSYNYKAFPSKAYSTQTTAFTFGTYYVVSGSSYQIIGTNSLLNGDPSNSNFNFNAASLGITGSFYWTSATQGVSVSLASTTQISSNVINVASPFIS